MILLANDGIKGIDNDPLRTKLSSESQLTAEVVSLGEIHIDQQTGTLTINGTEKAINDLTVVRADAGGRIDIDVLAGNLWVGDVMSNTEVDLRAHLSSGEEAVDPPTAAEVHHGLARAKVRDRLRVTAAKSQVRPFRHGGEFLGRVAHVLGDLAGPQRESAGIV